MPFECDGNPQGVLVCFVLLICVLKLGLVTFSVKGPIVNILAFAGGIVSVTTTQKAAIYRGGTLCEQTSVAVVQENSIYVHGWNFV